MEVLSSLMNAGLLLSTIGLVGLLIHWSIKNDGAGSIKDQTGLFKMRDFEAEEQRKTENKLRRVEDRLQKQDFNS
ncbi:hypothetical protein [Denitrobaculum tricleocarpae]|uniref:Uncharacterized protein n=1 Tax=Denitrobaculum tricleocarpae TaxID=2591009 RepID=A0A545TGE6_9PROT|nr:hypothetical protein [Denitrobaculum tricleocarpae]TQV76256.1 hypothetical protein FKG95_21735 [Denitrobaculum tricleocarpae]